MKTKQVILVVDDQTQNNDLLEAYLVPEGYEIIKATSGEEALQKLAAEPEAVRSASILVHIRQCAPCFDEVRELRRQLLQHP